MINQIIFAGNGHGGIAAFKSLQVFFSAISVVTEDNNILKLFRKSDHQISSIESVDLKYVVCAGYHSIISKKILATKIIINTHPSLLPKYRGLHSLVWAMLNFEKELGFTIHLMNEFIDDGDIIEQFKIKYENQTSQEIMLKFDKYVELNLGKIVRNFLQGTLKLKTQNKDEATWVGKRNISDCLIDFNRSNQYIRMMFKALVRPYPLPMIKIDNRFKEIDSCTIIDRKYEMHTARVINIEGSKVYVKTLDGFIIIENLIDHETQVKVQASKVLKIGQRL